MEYAKGLDVKERKNGPKGGFNMKSGLRGGFPFLNVKELTDGTVCLRGGRGGMWR